MKITLTTRSLTNSVYLTLNDETNEAKLNGNKISIDIQRFSSRLLTIISSWAPKMINTNILDGLSYSVKVEKDGKEYNYKGSNKFPDNFREFTNLLTEYKIWQ